MQPTLAIKTALRDLIQMLASGRYEELARDGRAGRLTADELRQAVTRYGRTLVAQPDAELKQLQIYQIDGHPDRLTFDIDLWTQEQGPSDLTLSGTIDLKAGAPLVKIDDLHVL